MDVLLAALLWAPIGYGSHVQYFTRAIEGIASVLLIVFATRDLPL